MKKFLILLLSILTIASVLSACDTKEPPADTVQTDAPTRESTQLQPEQPTQAETETEAETKVELVTPPQNTQPPMQVIEALDASAAVVQTGNTTWQAFLKENDLGKVQQAFTDAGYAGVKPTAIPGTAIESVVMYSADHVVTLQKTKDATYAIWQPYCEGALSLLFPNDATNTGEVIVAQIGVEREDEADNPMIGMCYVYKLADGSALIIDGGLNTESCRNNILSTLQALDIAKDQDGRYCVTAWILTHGHSDHRGAIVGFGKNLGDRVSLSYLLYNVPLGSLSTSTWDSAAFEEKMVKFFPDAQYVAPHAGLQYHFGNLTVQMLYSPEMLYAPDQPVEYYNNTSLAFITDCNGARVLHMGDAGELASTTAWELYEAESFKADVLQITHHGLYTGPDSHKWKNLKNIYNASDATLGFLPMGSRKPGDARNGRHTVLVGWGGSNYQVSFVINKRDKHEQSSISQEYYEQFVADVAAGTAKYPTLLGYDGINTITSDEGLLTYLSSNETTPMVTLISLSAQGAAVTHNQVLYDWFNK